MSLFAKIFGSKQNSGNAPSPQEAIQKLLEIEDLLRQRQKVLDKKIEDELEISKAHVVKNKRIALQALKRKIIYEQQLNQIDGTLTDLECKRESLEYASTNIEILKTIMGFTADSFKSMDLELDEVKLSIYKSSLFNLEAKINDDEVKQELKELEQETLNEQLLTKHKVATYPLPGVPISEPNLSSCTRKQNSSKISAEEAEINELKNWAS